MLLPWQQHEALGVNHQTPSCYANECRLRLELNTEQGNHTGKLPGLGDQELRRRACAIAAGPEKPG